MALGLGKDADEKAQLANLSNNPGFGSESYYDGFKEDVENGRNEPRYRKMSRIDAPITASISGSIEGRKSIDATGRRVSVSAQMEAEAGNAIKYRTCSWQKV